MMAIKEIDHLIIKHRFVKSSTITRFTIISYRDCLTLAAKAVAPSEVDVAPGPLWFLLVSSCDSKW